MPRRITAQAARYGIRITHTDGAVGWLTGKDASVLSFASTEEAQKALCQIKRGSHYSWNCEVDVAELPDNLRK